MNLDESICKLEHGGRKSQQPFPHNFHSSSCKHEQSGNKSQPTFPKNFESSCCNSGNNCSEPSIGRIPSQSGIQQADWSFIPECPCGRIDPYYNELVLANRQLDVLSQWRLTRSIGDKNEAKIKTNKQSPIPTSTNRQLDVLSQRRLTSGLDETNNGKIKTKRQSPIASSTNRQLDDLSQRRLTGSLDEKNEAKNKTKRQSSSLKSFEIEAAEGEEKGEDVEGIEQKTSPRSHLEQKTSRWKIGKREADA